MANAREIVEQSFAQAQTYANLAQTQLNTFTTALNGAIYSPPTVSVTWNSIATPSLPSLPSQPNFPTITYTAPTAPGDFVDEAPAAIVIDEFNVSPPSSTLQDALTAAVTARLAGGTGLSPAVESAIWARAQSRETALAQANQDDIARTAEAMGFMIPPGVVTDQIRVAQQNTYDKLAELSREIAIKQADLEQTNLNSAISEGTQLAGQAIQIYRTQADAYTAVVGAKAEVAKLGMARYESLIRAYQASIDAYKSKVDAERSRIEALTAQSRNLLDSYKAGAEAVVSTAAMYSKQYEVQVKDYEAGQQIVLQAAKINADSVNFANGARLDAAKVGAQVYAQLTSSAYSMIRAQASVSATGGTSVSYSYGNDTTERVPPITII